MSTLIDREMLQELMKLGAQLIEVLPAKEYAEDHLPGAVSYPLRKLEKNADRIDRKRPVIVYCWDSA